MKPLYLLPLCFGVSRWVFPYLPAPVIPLFYLPESSFLIYLSLKFVTFNRTFSLRNCVPKHWSHEGVYVISSCILRIKDLHEAVCLYPLPRWTMQQPWRSTAGLLQIRRSPCHMSWGPQQFSAGPWTTWWPRSWTKRKAAFGTGTTSCGTAHGVYGRYQLPPITWLGNALYSHKLNFRFFYANILYEIEMILFEPL